MGKSCIREQSSSIRQPVGASQDQTDDKSVLITLNKGKENVTENFSYSVIGIPDCDQRKIITNVKDDNAWSVKLDNSGKSRYVLATPKKLNEDNKPLLLEIRGSDKKTNKWDVHLQSTFYACLNKCLKKSHEYKIAVYAVCALAFAGLLYWDYYSKCAWLPTLVTFITIIISLMFVSYNENVSSRFITVVISTLIVTFLLVAGLIFIIDKGTLQNGKKLQDQPIIIAIIALFAAFLSLSKCIQGFLKAIGENATFVDCVKGVCDTAVWLAAFLLILALFFAGLNGGNSAWQSAASLFNLFTDILKKIGL